MAQDIIGKAWIGVGIKDETAPGLRKIESDLRRRSQSGGGGMGTGGFGAGRRGGREFGSFSGWNQLAFGLEDAAVSYQTNGATGALRAVSNNITLAALAFGGLRAQLLATALVVGAQLAPALVKMQGGMVSAAEMIERIGAAAKGLRKGLEIQFQAGELPGRIAGLATSGAAQSHADDAERRLRQIARVDRRSAEVELNTMRDVLRNVQRGEAAANWADKLGALGRKLYTGDETPGERIRILQQEIKARETLISNLDKESVQLQEERAAAQKRAEELRVEESQSKLSDVVRSIVGDLDPLVGPQEATRRASAERNRKLSRLFEGSNLDGSGLIGMLNNLDALRAQAGSSALLPGAASQFSTSGLQQAELNRRNQTMQRTLEAIRDAARETRTKLDELLDEIRSSDDV